VNSQLSEIFDYVPGIDVEERPPTTVARDEEMLIDDTFLNISSMIKTSYEKKKKEPIESEG
jgi:hypothetical protein